jgi:rhodanese-related sulfurtransferase
MAADFAFTPYSLLPAGLLTGRPNPTKPTDQNILMKSKMLALVASLFAAVTVYAGDFPDISVADLKKAIADKKVVVIDVNGTDSWKEGHVPTAIDFETKKAELAKVLPADKTTLVVAYCGGPSCGAYAAAAKKAKELGYTNVKHLSAGISGWKKAGEKTEAGK